MPAGGSSTAWDIDDFYVVLLKCAQFQSLRLFGENYTIPNIPATGPQIIYHEANTSNTSWANITQTFVANDDYDVVWIFPKNSTTSPGVALTAWLEIALPEIRDVSSCGIPCTTPTISPKGPIEYNTHWEWAVASSTFTPGGRYFLTSSSFSNNQWYLDDVPIPSYNGGTQYKLNPLDALAAHWDQNVHYFKVKNIACNTISTPVSFQLKYYFYPPHEYDQLITPFILNNPLHYCQNSNGYMYNFNLGAGTIYSWDVGFNLSPSNNYISVVPINNSNSAAVTTLSLPSNYPITTATYVLNIADLNGQQKVLDYSINLFPHTDRVINNSCINKIYASNYNPTNYLFPGGTKFDWEEYEFGPNCSLLNYAQYIISTSPLKIRVPGHLAQSSAISVQFTGNSYFKKHFYFNNNIGECLTENTTVNNPISCFTVQNIVSQSMIPESIVYPNPTSNNLTIFSKEIINYIEILDLMNPTLKWVNTKGTKSIIINVSDLKPGIYNCRITTSKGVENQKLIIKR